MHPIVIAISAVVLSLVTFISPFVDDQIPTTGVWTFHTEPMSSLTRNLDFVPISATSAPVSSLGGSDFGGCSIILIVDDIVATTSEVIFKMAKTREFRMAGLGAPIQDSSSDEGSSFPNDISDDNQIILICNCDTPKTVTAFVPIAFSGPMAGSTPVSFSTIFTSDIAPSTMVASSIFSPTATPSVSSLPMANTSVSSPMMSTALHFSTVTAILPPLTPIFSMNLSQVTSSPDSLEKHPLSS